ncbi:hypothetical protein [Streptosporangium subroseum]|uniref:hypothetical protein n=1 Tax=Streptosporangium subroseum TaxID=106412 RepID=UPI003090651A|nr:hypothetical protein OHB15_03285 [Streptosporangium subroseum]
MLRLLITLLAVALLLSGDFLLYVPRTFERYAAQAIWTWRTSGAAEIWHEGFVPFEELSAMSPEVGEQIDSEYLWAVAGPLPASPAEAQVRWDDGSTMRVPVFGAREALLAQSYWPEKILTPDDKTYKLTRATFTTMRLKTVRGMATVPAWRLHFSNLPGPIDQVAVDQAAVGTVEEAIGDYLLVDERVTDFEVLDERMLSLSYNYGSCGGPLDVTVRVREEPDVVVLGLDVPDQGPGPCAGVGRFGENHIRLNEPLGDRVVLDAITGLPVLCHRARNACHAGNG